MAFSYKQYGHLPEIQSFLYGIKPAIIAIILSAIYPLAKKSLKSIELISIGVAVLLLVLFQFSEFFILFGAGFAALVVQYLKNNRTNSFIFSVLPFGISQLSRTSPETVTNFNLFLIFIKIGAILYGSGYVLFAFLDAELVAKGMLTRTQLIDAIAVGQFTPGPVFSAVTFVGYQLNGVSGAIISTIAIFLPSFLFVALLSPLVKSMRNSEYFSSFLDAVNVASIAIIIAICYSLATVSITDWKTVSIAVVSIVLTFAYRKLNSAFVVLGGSFMGYLMTFL